ncbi:MAG: hypothetical protein EXR79_10075 [Myxococcales bacterium]|nr:hypothetical protein [Myxococcales bacterium]
MPTEPLLSPPLRLQVPLALRCCFAVCALTGVAACRAPAIPASGMFATDSATARDSAGVADGVVEVADAPRGGDAELPCGAAGDAPDDATADTAGPADGVPADGADAAGADVAGTEEADSATRAPGDTAPDSEDDAAPAVDSADTDTQLLDDGAASATDGSGTAGDAADAMAAADDGMAAADDGMAVADDGMAAADDGMAVAVDVAIACTTDCDDGNACTQGDQCADGMCIGGGAVACDDGLACTDDGCNPKVGCTTSPNSAPCNDGSVCTTVDTCVGGKCGAGKPMACDDKNPCTSNACNAGTGCTFPAVPNANNQVCDDGNGCTIVSACVNGKCVGKDPLGIGLDCNDGNPCTTDTCEFMQGGCKHVHVAPGTACGGGSCAQVVWTPPGACNLAGQCVAAPAKSCSDASPCTQDVCNAAQGCLYKPALEGALCDDGNGCTASDTCQGGACSGKAVACNDSNSCTVDSCSKANGCVALPLDATACVSGKCTVGDQCKAGACVAGTKPKFWSLNFGGPDDDSLGGLVALPDGSLAAAGTTSSFAALGKGGKDVWFIRIAPDGSLLCTATFGGPGNDEGPGVDGLAQLAGGRFMIGARTSSGTIGGGTDNGDGWALSVDPDCKLIAAPHHGTAGMDIFWGAAALADGGAAFVGETTNVLAKPSGPDAWVVWTNQDGTATGASAVLGGAQNDRFHHYAALPGGGGAACGFTDSLGAGEADAYVARFDVAHNVVWARTLGGFGVDSCRAVAGLPNGDLALFGFSNTPGVGTSGTYDAWFVRLDGSGAPQAYRSFGSGIGDDFGLALEVLPSGRMVVAGQVASAKGNTEFWRGEIDAMGDLAWQRTFTGPGTVGVNAVALLPDGGLAFAGLSGAPALGAGKDDALVMRTSPWGHYTCEGAGPCATVTQAACEDGIACSLDACSETAGCTHLDTTAPCADGVACSADAACAKGSCQPGAPALQTFVLPGPGGEQARGLAWAANGDIVAVGTTFTLDAKATSAYVVRARATGPVWTKLIDTGGTEQLRDVIATADGGLLAVGSLQPVGATSSMGWVVRLDGTGAVLATNSVGSGGFVFTSVTRGADAHAYAAFHQLVAGNQTDCGVRRVADNAQAPNWVAIPDAAITECWGIAPGPGNLVVVGETQANLLSSDNGYVALVSLAGTLVVTKAIGGVADDEFRAVAAIAAGGYVAVGASNAFPKGTSDSNGWVVRLAPDLSTLWERHMGGAGNDYLVAVEELADGSFLVGGNRRALATSEADAWMARLDANGNPSWDKTWGFGPSQFCGIDAILATGTGVIALATLDPVGASVADFVVVRLDAWGHATCAEAGACLAVAAGACSDGNSCTADSCVGAGKCANFALADGSACGSGKLCKAGMCP